ncbi:MAG: AMP-binding protein [Gammaproteobacteria bacterium]
MVISPQAQETDSRHDDQEDREAKLLAIVRGLTFELHPKKRGSLRVGLQSRLDRDLGIDSLGRAEMLLRIERAFRVRLPESLVGDADTPEDFLRAIEHANKEAVVPGHQAAVPMAPELPVITDTPQAATTLIDVLDWHVARHPKRPHVTILQDDRTEIRTLSYQELDKEARSLACGLRRRGLQPGDRVAVMLRTSPEFFVAFFGILLSGAIPVPIYPPFRPSQLEEHLKRQAGILRSAEASMLITTHEARAVASLLELQVESLEAIATVEELQQVADAALPTRIDQQAAALIQYTSGSTGDPKGAVLSHANLLANIRAMGQAMNVSSKDVFVSWLPLYHDMGLIGAWLGSLYYACPLYVMSPVTFLVRPEAWLWAIHRYRATLSAAPNFAFELCLNKIEDDMLDGLDLGSLRMVANGAEPVSANTVRRFIARFRQYGFRPEAMAPVYGLAENSVGLAFSPPNRAPIVDRVQRDPLVHMGIAEPATADDPTKLEFVCCGRPLPGHEIRIIDETGREVPERYEGRLEFRGPSATRGYFRNREKTRELYDNDWLDSADRGYFTGGEVFITGRIKDIIIRAGRNIYPQELEEAVGDLPGIRKGCVAVFGCKTPSSGTERLVVLAETRETEQSKLDSLRQLVGETAADLLDTPVDEVVLAPPRSVPKTSSGKIRRAAAKETYESGRIGAAPRRLWWQVLRLALAGVVPRFRRTVRLVRDVLYAGYWWTIIGPGLALTWFVLFVTPRQSQRWRIARFAARVGLKVARVPITVEGLHHLPAKGGVLVCNHVSYLDSFVLAAVLPGEPVFVAKQELMPQLFAGTLLRRLGVVFVEREDPEAGVADTRAVAKAAGARGLLVFFPEGTFTREPGLLPFRLGAFIVASNAQRPVVPAGIRGTRSILRSGYWFPRKGEVHVEIGPSIGPTESGFAGALRLRDAARAEILKRCGEPDLAEG